MVCVCTSLPTYPSAFLPTYLPAFLPTCLPTHLPTYYHLPTYPSISFES